MQIYCIFYRVVVEPLMRIELTTSSLPRKCSTTELQRLLTVGNALLNSNGLRYKPTCQPFAANMCDERETRLELATYSLEGYRSTK
jgi:hypothetical protein